MLEGPQSNVYNGEQLKWYPLEPEFSLIQML